MLLILFEYRDTLNFISLIPQSPTAISYLHLYRSNNALLTVKPEMDLPVLIFVFLSTTLPLRLSLFIPGSLHLTSSRAAVWRRPNCTPYSSTQCSPVGASELEVDYTIVYFVFAVE